MKSTLCAESKELQEAQARCHRACLAPMIASKILTKAFAGCPTTRSHLLPRIPEDQHPNNCRVSSAMSKNAAARFVSNLLNNWSSN
eukprot:CAMPEP_0169111660 /NCGR_PEP_ID=MMETSP1015-20121227/27197_1 /TAXON_ID=342587 /ORGANISM="Karlodinium micrum, Strain CCMP2283" /LENGTH=85 /DNA_ID=CAMNT_0009173599 /DNA_START=457 /DNA_END=714 /DNA_ORIENTATION=-